MASKDQNLTIAAAEGRCAGHPNPVVSGILSHVSVRRFKEGTEIPGKTLELLLAAALRAPVGALLHFYTMIVLDGQQREAMRNAFPNAAALRDSAQVLFCADIRRMTAVAARVVRRRRVTGLTALLFSAIDASLAAQNMCLAAESLGLGTCIIGAPSHRADEVIEIMNLPRGVLPLFIVALGYPDEAPGLRPRIPLDLMAFEGSYRDITDADADRIIDALGSAYPARPGVEQSRDEKARAVGGLLEGQWWVHGEAVLKEVFGSHFLLEP